MSTVHDAVSDDRDTDGRDTDGRDTDGRDTDGDDPAGGDLPAVLGGFDLTDQSRFAPGFPHDVFAVLRREAPVLFHPPGRTADGEGFWVLSGHAEVTAAAGDPVFSAQGGGGRAGGGTHLDDLELGVHAGVLLPMMDDPRHDLLKGLLRPGVAEAAVAGAEGDLRELADGLVAAAVARGGADFAAEVAGEFATRALARVLGARREDAGELVAWARETVGFTNRRTGEPDERSGQTYRALHAYAKTLLAAKRADPADDLATAVALAELPAGSGQPPLTEYEREVNIILLLMTGGEQPRNTLAAGVLALAEHPEQWQALRADRSLLPRAVEEVLRWAPPNPYNRRTATRDVQLRDAVIRAGDKVTLWWPSANRDEAVFPHADRFDVRRVANPHVTFGFGGHLCLGDGLGRTELRLLLGALLDQVAEIRPAGPVTWAPSNKHSVVLDMPVTLVPDGAGTSAPAAGAVRR